jgi:hypothetical protein
MADTSDTESLALSQTERPRRLYRWVLSGLALFLAAFPLLFWNESRTLGQYRRSGEGVLEVHPVRMDRIDPDMNGKLVHVSGLAITGETLRDPVFGVAANAVKLRRRVQVYQWREKTVPVDDAAGGGDSKTAVVYDAAWSDRIIPSSEFQAAAEHPNPPAFPYADREFTAKTVTLGAYTLSQPFIEQIDRFRPLKLDREALSRLPADIRWDARRQPDGFFIGDDPEKPAVGDMRATFQAAGPLTVTVVGRQAGNLLLPYPSDKGMISLLRVGAHSVEGVFPPAREGHAALIWGLRLGGFALMFLGLALIFVPVMRDAETGGPFVRGLAAKADPWLLAFLAAAALSFAVIAAVWFVVRPILAAVLLGAAVVFLLGVRMLPEHDSA